MRGTPLTPDEIRCARHLRAEGRSWPSIATKMRRDPETIRRAIDPDYDVKRRKRMLREARAVRIAGEAKRQIRNPEFDPVRDGPPVFSTPFSELLGEPPIGRRAIDKGRDL